MSASRKEDHVRLAVSGNVQFREKTNGLDAIELPYNALPELDFAEIDCSQTFLGKQLRAPFMLTGMTGGYPDAERINGELASACAELGIAMGLGSMRQALLGNQVSTFGVVKQFAGEVPLVANIGGVQAVESVHDDKLDETIGKLIDIIGASAIAIHLNPLQELLQPEGEPRFRGVLDAIQQFVEASPVPIIVKEVGAGISGTVADKLASVGVSIVDVAGAGGTSWAGVEILRQPEEERADTFWDVGIPTAECLRMCRGKVPTLIASGGVVSGSQAAKAIALGASIVGTARPALQVLENGSRQDVVDLFIQWELDLRRWMFLTGSQTLHILDTTLQNNH